MSKKWFQQTPEAIRNARRPPQLETWRLLKRLCATPTDGASQSLRRHDGVSKKSKYRGAPYTFLSSWTNYPAVTRRLWITLHCETVSVQMLKANVDHTAIKNHVAKERKHAGATVTKAHTSWRHDSKRSVDTMCSPATKAHKIWRYDSKRWVDFTEPGTTPPPLHPPTHPLTATEGRRGGRTERRRRRRGQDNEGAWRWRVWGGWCGVL